MHVTILGSGTAVTHLKRLPSGYWVDCGSDVRLRLDAGAGTLYAAARLGLNWETLTHQFISHFHIDHVLDLPMLLFALKFGRENRPRVPLNIIGPVGLSALIEKLAAALQPNLLQQVVPVAWHELAPGMAMPLGEGVTLKVAKSAHMPESLSARIDTPTGSLGYTGDTARHEPLFEFFRGVDALIAECSFIDDARNTPHLVASEVAELATRAETPHLITTHAYFDPATEPLRERVARGFKGRHTIAEDGMTIEVGRAQHDANGAADPAKSVPPKSRKAKR